MLHCMHESSQAGPRLALGQVAWQGRKKSRPSPALASSPDRCTMCSLKPGSVALPAVARSASSSALTAFCSKRRGREASQVACLRELPCQQARANTAVGPRAGQLPPPQCPPGSSPRCRSTADPASCAAGEQGISPSPSPESRVAGRHQLLTPRGTLPSTSSACTSRGTPSARIVGSAATTSSGDTCGKSSMPEGDMKALKPRAPALTIARRAAGSRAFAGTSPAHRPTSTNLHQQGTSPAGWRQAGRSGHGAAARLVTTPAGGRERGGWPGQTARTQLVAHACGIPRSTFNLLGPPSSARVVGLPCRSQLPRHLGRSGGAGGGV